MLVRRASRGDLLAVAQVHVLTWQTCYRGLMPDAFLDGLSVSEREASWQKFLEQPQRVLLVCRAERKTVGFASFGMTRDSDRDPASVGELYAIYVVPEFWGRGCGRALWQRARKDLLRAGFSEVTLWVLEANARAREFYQRQGFHRDPAASKEAHVSGVKLPEVRYSLRLRR